ncbi:adenylate/guanylate cyclase domain-containing protein [Phormidesmis priestleyi ULC007]|uniref:Adenylate/guanylate cyclase domain-containing protein n=1 Tax=Phormidesmis priestleyi ULC007 TaxID=1920490 RepID=A0A2T1DP53_9CYAN|nr:adenylate/guanylate cyclase domain-containing protein [Phormidesmis priestleyi]PSB22225.1 adenylate/guanylate cyclase domain-containing protein [Phormidesmis priestleyi ULC007]PZO52514.1 MAG: adenylate/guanylate cyclase domain-containing protein [Phormidesmis priestleyi]
MVTLQPTPHLVLRTDSGSRRFPLIGGSCWTVGRSEDNNVVLSDRWISRNHAMLQSMENGEFYLIDLGSRNGSFINGRRVSIPVTLQNGDRLTFGQTEIEFYCPVHQQIEGAIGMDSKEFTATATLHIRRLISVLVVDIRDFTGLTRQLDEKILSEVIGTWFRCAGDIIREYGSWVDKYIGDAVMSVWTHGAQGVNRDEMLRIFQAVNALHTMTSSLYNQYPLPFPLKIGAGINTGYAMVGNTGSGDRPDYTALGDTVNAAFRLESATKQIGLDIAIGETTHHHLSTLVDDANFFEQYTVHLKGYEVPTLTHACSFGDLDAFLQTKVGSSG